MTKLKEKLIPLSFMLALPVLGVFYNLLNNGDGGVYSLVTDMDKGIPFLKIFIIPYIVWYIYLFITLGYLCFKDTDTYYKTLMSYCLGIVVCYIIYSVYQTSVPRPVLTGNDMLTRAVGFIYSIDQPFNCFPSIHSLSSYLMIKAINISSAKNIINSILINGISVSIILSTLFVKQHVVLDALSAVLLGDIVFKIVCNFNMEKAIVWIKRMYSLLMVKRKLEI